MRFDRGQAHTLEGVVAALLLLSSLLFALQVTTVTPLSASTSSQHIENQQRAVGIGLLSSAAEQRELKPALLFWNGSAGKFINGTVTDGYSQGPPNEFGQILNESLSENGIAYNIEVRYLTALDGPTKSREMVNQGFPSDNAVTVTRTVVLTEGDVLYNGTGRPSSKRLGEIPPGAFYADNVDPNSSLFNVITVEVTIWRI